MTHTPLLTVVLYLETGDGTKHESQEPPYAELAAPLGVRVNTNNPAASARLVTLSKEKIVGTKVTIAGTSEQWAFQLVPTDYMTPQTPWRIVVPGLYTKTFWLYETEHTVGDVHLADLPSADTPTPRLDTQQLKAGPAALKATNTPIADTIVTVDKNDPTRFHFEQHENIGDGLTETEVDQRIENQVKDWAQTGSSRTIPDNIIPSTIARDTELNTAKANLDRKLAVEQNDRKSAIAGEAAARKAFVGSLSGRIDDIRQVPSTPGTSTGIGHVLTVTGENDEDYAWRQAEGGDTPNLDTRITTNATNISELETEVATASRSIADNEGRLTTAETDINNLEAEDSTLAASIATNTTSTQTNAGNIATNSNLITAATRTLQSLVTEVDTLHPKIGRLVPITPWIRSNTARTLHFAWFPLVAVTRGARLTIVIGGVTHTISAPEAYAATDVDGLVLSVPVNASNSATITREANTSAGHVRVDLTMGDQSFHAYISAEDAPATATPSRILLAATAATTTDTLTLPTSYTNFKWFTIVGANSAGGSGSVTVPTAWLAVHTTQVDITYPTTQNGPNTCLLYTSPSPRDS